jgi:hypothetical protein
VRGEGASIAMSICTDCCAEPCECSEPYHPAAASRPPKTVLFRGVGNSLANYSDEDLSAELRRRAQEREKTRQEAQTKKLRNAVVLAEELLLLLEDVPHLPHTEGCLRCSLEGSVRLMSFNLREE